MNSIWTLPAGIAFALLFPPPSLSAHCDALDGPIVVEAQAAFRDRDVTPMLKWVAPEHEAAIGRAFARATAVAVDGNAEARDLAETWFLETLVRIHREGEGAPFLGLQPAGQIDPAVQLADAALAQGSAEALANKIGTAVSDGIRVRFEEAAAQLRHAPDSATAGRAFVAAYVEYVHFVEGIHSLVIGGAGHAH